MTIQTEPQEQVAEPKQLPIYGSESIMSRKQHGTSETPVQRNLRWGANRRMADRISNYNRHWAEPSGYLNQTRFVRQATKELTKDGQLMFCDSNTGKPLFVLQGKGGRRSWDEFLRESRSHGWPSFRDEEVVWENVRCLLNGECVSIDGTHLGHNLPDRYGNRYCINLVSVAGQPTKTTAK